MDLAGQVAKPGEGFSRLGMQDPFLRFEPVPAPAVLLQEPLDITRRPGETIDQVVVRSSENKDEVVGNSIRNFCPPRGRLDLAELHGCFDSGRTPYTVGSFDAVSLPNGDFPTDKSGNAIYEVPTASPEPSLYLPDPMADFLVIHIEAPTGETIRVSPEPFYPKDLRPANLGWPRAARIQVELQPNNEDRITIHWRKVKQKRSRPYQDERLHRLVVGLPPAWKALMRVRSGIAKDKCSLMAAGTFLKYFTNLLGTFAATASVSVVPPAERLQAWFDEQCEQGTVDMLTPSRDITLVHAVVLPLKEPQLSEICVHRQSADPAAYLRVSVNADRKSTARVDIKASWTELNDDPTQRKLVESPSSGEVVQIAVPEEREDNEGVNDLAAITLPDLKGIPSYQVRHAFVDTIHRKVTYEAFATSRFQRYFPEPKIADPKQSARFVRQGKSTSQTIHILSTARPPAPEIAYVLPIYEWKSEKPFKHSFRSTRIGGGLRVYLKRPWFKSGANERVGIVLWGESHLQHSVAPTQDMDSCAMLRDIEFAGNSGDTLLRQYVTRWGADPAWSDEVRLLSPSSSMFRHETVKENGSLYEAGQVVHGLSLEEVEPTLSSKPRPRSGSSEPDENTPSRPVSVVTYEPLYDQDKRLWYCDIYLSTIPAYSCFIRLAIVRYQPFSVRHSECSHVSIATFAQLPANRSVMVSRSKQKKAVHLEIRGAAAGISDSGRPNQFDLIIERIKHDIEGDIHWQVDTCQTIDTQAVQQPGDPLLAATTVQCRHHGPKRLIVKEYEWIKADSKDPLRPNDTRLERRLVYADALAIPDL